MDEDNRSVEVKEAFEAFFRDLPDPDDFWGYLDFLDEVKHRFLTIEQNAGLQLIMYGSIPIDEKNFNDFAQAVSVAARRPGNERFFTFLKNAFLRYARFFDMHLDLDLLAVGDIFTGEGGVWDLTLHHLWGNGWFAYLDNGDQTVWEPQHHHNMAENLDLRSIRFERRPGDGWVGSM